MNPTILDVCQLRMSQFIMFNYRHVTQKLFYTKALDGNWIKNAVNKLNYLYKEFKSW